jgi:hypothetical protein
MAQEKAPAFQFYRKTQQRFWLKVQVLPDGQCWLWRGARDVDGYGFFWDGAANRRAHRYSYALKSWDAFVDGHVLHSCDNPSCVNPDHLRLGTHGDNIRDRNAKGRHNLPSGERHWHKALDQDKADGIRSMVERGLSQASASKAFGVSPATVCRLINGQQRKELA